MAESKGNAKMPILLYRGEHFDSNFFYSSGVDLDHSFFLSNPRVLFVPKLNFTLARRLFSGRVIAYSNVSEVLGKFIRKKQIRMLGTDFRSLPVSAYKKLSKLARLKDYSEQFLLVRAKKRKNEISKIRKAVQFSKKIFSELESRIHHMKTESDVRSFLLTRTLELGLEPAFEPITASGSNSRFPHYQSGNNAKLHDMVLVDYGVRYEHYCSDLTRCFFLKHGTKAEKTYLVMQEMFADIIDNFPDFVSGKGLAVFTEKLYAKHSLPLPPHSIGHGIGLDVHEYPRLSKRYKDLLVGTTMAIEPSAYFNSFEKRSLRKPCTSVLGGAFFKSFDALRVKI